MATTFEKLKAQLKKTATTGAVTSAAPSPAAPALNTFGRLRAQLKPTAQKQAAPPASQYTQAELAAMAMPGYTNRITPEYVERQAARNEKAISDLWYQIQLSGLDNPTLTPEQMIQRNELNRQIKAKHAETTELQKKLFETEVKDIYYALDKDTRQLVDLYPSLTATNEKVSSAYMMGNELQKNQADLAMIQSKNEIKRLKDTLSGKGYSQRDIERLLAYVQQKSDAAEKELTQLKAENLAKEHPVAASIASVGTNLLSGFGIVDVLGQNVKNAVTGYDIPVNYATGTMQMNAYTDAIRGQVQKDIEAATPEINLLGHNVLSQLYGVGMSLADLAAATAVTGGFSAVGKGKNAVKAFQTALKSSEGGVLALFGTKAATSATVDAVSRGASDHEALLYGILNGAAEIVFEKVSIDNLISMKDPERIGTIIFNALKQGGIEGSEEAFTTIANTMTDLIVMGDKSEIATAINDGKPAGEVALDWFKGLAWDFIGGTVSGGLSAGTMSTMSYVKQTPKAAATGKTELPPLAAQGAADMAEAQNIRELAPLDTVSPGAEDGALADAARVESGRDAGQPVELPGLETIRPAADKAQTGQLNAAQPMELPPLQNNNMIGGETNVGRENEVLRGSGQRYDSVDTGGQIGGLAEGPAGGQGGNLPAEPGLAGRTGAGAIRQAGLKTQNMTARERRDILNRINPERVSTRSLGIPDGTDETVVAVYPEARWDNEMTETAGRLQARGWEVTYFTGSLQVQAGPDIVMVNGAAGNGRVLIQADHPRLTVRQIGDHEMTHGILAESPGSVTDILGMISETYSPQEIIDISREYMIGYHGAYGEESIMPYLEEIVADAYAGINRFGTKASKYSDAVRQAVDAYAGTTSVPQDANTTRGPPEETAARYSIEELPDGTKYVNVDTDQHIFNGLTLTQMQRAARREIIKRFRGKVIGKENRAYVQRETAGEYAYPAKYFEDENIKVAKMRASTEIDNLMTIGEHLAHYDDDGRHPDATGGWDRYSTIFKVDGRMFRGEIAVVNTDRGSVFYDITKIADITESPSSLPTDKSPGPATSNDAYTDTIPPADENVKYSAEGEEVERSLIIEDGVARWTPERIKRLMSYYAASNPNYSKAYAVYISPSDYLSLTTTNVNKIENEARPLDIQALNAETQEINLAYTSGEGNEIDGHEGRHRMVALRDAGIEQVAVVLIDRDEGTKYNKKPLDELTVTGQTWGERTAPGVVTLKELVPISRAYENQITEKFGGEAQVRFSIDEDSDGNALTQAQTEFFKDSQVRDEAGRLLVVYHGTGTTINEFNESLTGQGNDQFGSGFYFTTDEDGAKGYTTATLNGQPKLGGSDNPNIIPAYLNIQNPIRVNDWEESNLYNRDVKTTDAAKIIGQAPNILDHENSILGDYFDTYWTSGPKNSMIQALARDYDWTLGTLEGDIFKGNATAFRKAAYEVLGYDGVEVTFNNGVKHYVAWFPNQIKRIDNKNPTANPDIRYSAEDAEEYAPTFYSKMERVIEAYKGDKIAAGSLESFLKGRGVKNDEIKWSGVLQFVEGKKSVTKDELLDYLRANSLQVREENYGYTEDKERRIAEYERQVEDAWLAIQDYGMEIGGGVVADDDAIKATPRGAELFRVYDELMRRERFVYAEADDTRYGQYSLKGGRNYREILFTLPKSFDGFASPHWDEPNVLAHTRLQDFTAADGGKVLFADEIQSDWHEQGRERGYRLGDIGPDDIDLIFYPPEVPEGADPSNYPGYWESYDKTTGQMITRHPGRMTRENAMQEALDFGQDARNKGIPDAPYRDTWHELVLKRLLRMAAEGNYDYLAWTTGQMQVDRYPGLASVISKVKITNRNLAGDGEYTVRAYDKEGRLARHGGLDDASVDDITALYGKEIGRKIIEAADNNRRREVTIAGEDLVLGGEGMINFYDIGGRSSQNIPRFLDKYVRQWGSRVQEIEIVTGSEMEIDQTRDHDVAFAWDGETTIPIPNDDDYLVETYDTVPAIDITQEMRRSVLYEGQTRYSVEDETDTTEQAKLTEDDLINMAAADFEKLTGMTKDEAFAPTGETYYSGKEKKLIDKWIHQHNREVSLNAGIPGVTDGDRTVTRRDWEAFIKESHLPGFMDTYGITDGGLDRNARELYEGANPFFSQSVPEDVTVREYIQKAYNTPGIYLYEMYQYAKDTEKDTIEHPGVAGNWLNPWQVEYFKDSAVRNAAGQLMQVSHGAEGAKQRYTIFDTTGSKTEIGTHFGTYDTASSFAYSQYAATHGSEMYHGFLNIKNPLRTPDIYWQSRGEKGGVRNLYTYIQEKLGAEDSPFTRNPEYEMLEEAAKGDNLRDIVIATQDYVKSLGYDGIVYKNIVEGKGSDSWIIFDANQFKETKNLKPSEDTDIRYSVEDEKPMTRQQRREKARREFANNLLDAFSVIGSKRRALREQIDGLTAGMVSVDAISDKNLKDVFDALYESGVVQSSADDTYAEIRTALKGPKQKGTRIFVPENVKHEFGDDWNDFRRRAFANKVYFVSDAKAISIDQKYTELAGSFRGIFDADETNLDQMLRDIVDAVAGGRSEKLTLEQAAYQEGGSDAVSAQIEYLDSIVRGELEKLAENWSVPSEIRAAEEVKKLTARERVDYLRQLYGLDMTEEYSQRLREELRGQEGTVPEGMTIDEYVDSLEQAAAQDKAERVRFVSREEFRATPALEKLGVRVDGGVADYSFTAALIARDKAAKSVRKEIKKAEKRLGAKPAEKRFAAGVAAGVYMEADIPRTMDAGTVMELSDYYAAEAALGEDMIRQRRRDINQNQQEAAEGFFSAPEKYKMSPMLILNNRTPQRNMLNIFGDKQGAAVNAYYFDPVGRNSAEMYRFVNRQLDSVRYFEDSAGKKKRLTKEERSLVQQVIEGKAAAELVAGMETRKAIENAAENVRNGEDIGDAAREFSLNDTERDLARKYSRWLQTQEIIESGRFDSVKIQRAADKYTALFDAYYAAINDFLVAHGYEPIGWIKGYAPHMQPQANQNVLMSAFEALGINTDVTKLPTDIAGLTADYKPNKRWNPYFLHRTTDITEYDIESAFQSYVTYLGNVLYHTDDIMRVRQAVNYLRKTYAPEEIRSNIEWAENLRDAKPENKLEMLRDAGRVSRDTIMSDTDISGEMDSYIDELYGDIKITEKYSDLVVWLDNYANILAGKQAMQDRGWEYGLGRKILNLGNKLNSAFAKAQVAGNLSSALNQTSQLSMITSENGLVNTMAAVKDIITGATRRGSWAQESDFLTGKKGVDFLVTQWSDMLIEKMFKPLEWMDRLTSTIAVRGRYLKEVRQGASHADAIKAADKYARSIMASRMKGERPLGFEAKNPLSQMTHIFQLEVMNSWEHITQDLPHDFRMIEEKQGKAAAVRALAGVIIKMLLTAFMINRVSEELYGGTPAMFDLIGLSSNFIASGNGLSNNDYIRTVIDNGWEQLTGDRLFGTEELDAERDFDWSAAFEDTGYTVSNDIPYFRNVAGLLGWGDQTLPMLDAEGIYTGFSDLASSIAAGDGLGIANNAVDILGKILPGGRQISKTYEGLQAIIRGGYFRSGKDGDRLQYPVGNALTDYARGGLFGRSGLQETQDFYASGESGLSAKQTQMYRELIGGGADPETVYETIQAVRAVPTAEERGGDAYETLSDAEKAALSRETAAEKRQTIVGAALSDDEKAPLYSGLISAGRDEEFAAMMDAGMSWADVMEAYGKYVELDAAENMAASDKADDLNTWAKATFSKRQAKLITDSLVFYSHIPAEAKRIEQFAGAGLSNDDAYETEKKIDDLEPEPGKADVSDMQRYYAVATMSYSDDMKLAALETIMEPKPYAKLISASDAGITVYDYIRYLDDTSVYKADVDEKGNAISGSKKKKVLAYIDEMELENEQKDLLYILAGYAESEIKKAPWHSGRKSGGGAMYTELPGL